jgi:hypothetical protein
MKRFCLFMSLILSVISAEAQRVDYADTVKITKVNVLGTVAARTPTIPLITGTQNLGGHLYFMYTNVSLPVLAVCIENDGSEIFQRLEYIANCRSDEYGKVVYAEREHRNYNPLKIYLFDITLQLDDSYVIKPQRLLPTTILYSTLAKIWNSEKECYDIAISIASPIYVKTKNYKDKLKESTLLKEDINSITVEYGDEKIQIPLCQLSTSRLMSRFKKIL